MSHTGRRTRADDDSVIIVDMDDDSGPPRIYITLHKDNQSMSIELSKLQAAQVMSNSAMPSTTTGAGGLSMTETKWVTVMGEMRVRWSVTLPVDRCRHIGHGVSSEDPALEAAMEAIPQQVGIHLWGDSGVLATVSLDVDEPEIDDDEREDLPEPCDCKGYEMSDPEFDECENCEHHSSEHTGGDGACTVGAWTKQVTYD